jgi:hypothetical protein
MSKKPEKAVDMVVIHSVKEYFNMIAKELSALPKIQEVDLIKVKAKIIRLFQQELYGQIIFKFGPEAAEMKPDDLADMEGIQNILQQTFRKWRRLCILLSEHGLGNFFRLEDLKEALKDGPNADVKVPDIEEDVTDKLDEILPPGEKPVIMKENEDGGIEPADRTVENDTVESTAEEAAQDVSSEAAAN